MNLDDFHDSTLRTLRRRLPYHIRYWTDEAKVREQWIESLNKEGASPTQLAVKRAKTAKRVLSELEELSDYIDKRIFSA